VIDEKQVQALRVSDKTKNGELSMKTKRNFQINLFAMTMLAASVAAPVLATSKEKLDERARDLTQYFDTLQQDATKAVPAEILRKAEALVIMRNYKAGFIVGISGGHGVAIVRDKNTRKWGPIGFMGAGEGSFGLQAGVQRSDMILALMNADGMKVLTERDLKLGVDIRATVGPKSGGDEASFGGNTPVLVYGDTRGLFGGAAIETGSVHPDGDDNEDYYGRKLAVSDILVGGQVKPTEAAKLLAEKIDKYASVGAPKPLSSKEDSILVSVTATVRAIDHEKREITLKNDLGNVVTFIVDKEVKRLDEVKVGDQVSASYYISVAGELRPPTDEEKANPITTKTDEVRASKGSAPTAGSVHMIKAVTTVVGLDLPTQTVTLTGPYGNYATVRAKSVDNLKKLRLGDTIVVTYSEAFAISVEKVPALAKAE
jgi:lipid-binding SYLF domain-containing protein